VLEITADSLWQASSTTPKPTHFFGNQSFSKPRSIATRFCRQFSSVATHKTTKRSRRIQRNLKKTHQIDPTFKPFTSELTKKAILQSANSSALGPDKLMSLHLKFLGPKGIAYLTELYNLSIVRADIPSIWKQAKIVPIPKPGKPVNQSTGYRPISLLSPAVKVLERLLLPYLMESFPRAVMQHGYQPFHSTTTALLPLVTKIAVGFNKNKPVDRMVVVSLDISKAFDSVNHDLLLEKIAGTNLNSNIVHWLNSYLWGRTAVCLFQGARSDHFRCHLGVPQGSVLSPHLLYIKHEFVKNTNMSI
jgi:hypothetical protein